MDEQELHHHIVRQLGARGNWNDLIKEVCEFGGMQWNEAERMVEDISCERSHEIARRRFPIIFFVGLATIVIGMAIIYLGIAPNYASLFHLLKGAGENPAGEMLTLIMDHPEILDSSILGLAMIIGGSIGIGWALAEMHN